MSPLVDSYWFQEGPGVRNWQFKDSGIKLLNVANIEKSGNLNLNKTSRYLSVEEVDAKYSHFLIDAGDLVIASSGIAFDTDGMLRTRGAFVDESHLPLCLNTSTIRFKAKPGISDLGYLKHWLDSLEFREEITRRVTGSAQQNFGPSHLKALKITLPPILEQRRIAAILDKADALRAKRREALAQLDSLTQSIFIEMFGDPATDSPKWPSIELDSVAELVTGYPFRSEDYVGLTEGIKLCRGANVLPGRLDWRDTACWPYAKVSEADAFQLQSGDIVMAMDRPWISEGFKLAQVTAADCPLLLVQRVARIRPSSAITNEYLFSVLSHAMFARHCKPTETTIPHISPKDIRSYAFPLPPFPLQQKFAAFIQSVEVLKATHNAALQELDRLFASLQHRAFQGEL
jgi:type I restriction enzyme S subunit